MAEPTAHPPTRVPAPHDAPPRRVLVAYATRHGSTREVAETIATTLQEHGERVDLRAAADCHDLSAYRAIVLGGALYMGRWHRDARTFLRRHSPTLQTRPIAIFAMGPQSMDERSVRGARRQLDNALRRFRDLDPMAVTIFGGVIDPADLRFPFNRMKASDARDWDTIRAWATELTSRLAASNAPTADGPEPG
ncbi:MAG TPA: flavodoxin domain-containing protein [Conexibacter sp.]|nr:flavodoxin domain-containing protein [Conexibacter sp.]